MFKKLRNRFLIVNLVSISIMMLVAFATIYTITYQNVQRETNMELYKVSDFYHSPYNSSKMPRGEGQGSGTGVVQALVQVLVQIRFLPIPWVVIMEDREVIPTHLRHVPFRS